MNGMLTNDMHTRLRRLVENVYTMTATTRGGIIVTKRPKERELDHARARAVVEFAADFHPDFAHHMTPDALWSALMDELIADGTLVREANGVLCHRYDAGNMRVIAARS